jgi:hypothetical protein
MGAGRKIGIRGQAPGEYPDAALRTTLAALGMEKKPGGSFVRLIIFTSPLLRRTPQPPRIRPDEPAISGEQMMLVRGFLQKRAAQRPCEGPGVRKCHE